MSATNSNRELWLLTSVARANNGIMDLFRGDDNVYLPLNYLCCRWVGRRQRRFAASIHDLGKVWPPILLFLAPRPRPPRKAEERIGGIAGQCNVSVGKRAPGATGVVGAGGGAVGQQLVSSRERHQRIVSRGQATRRMMLTRPHAASRFQSSQRQNVSAGC